MSEVRRTVEERSAVLLLFLRQLPRWVPFLVVLAATLGGLFGHGAPAGFAIIVIFLFVGWLSYLAWPVLTPPARLARAAALVVLLVAAVLRVIT